MKTIVAGSRDGVTLKIVENAMQDAPFEITEVVSGTARGADRFGEIIAKKYNLPLHRFPANWNKYGRRAGYLRNVEMAMNAEALVAIQYNNSRGTEHMINIAKDKGLRIFVYKV